MIKIRSGEELTEGELAKKLNPALESTRVLTENMNQAFEKTRQERIPEIVREDGTPGTLEDLKNFPTNSIILLRIKGKDFEQYHYWESFFAIYRYLQSNKYIRIDTLDHRYPVYGYDLNDTDLLQIVLVAKNNSSASIWIRELALRTNTVEKELDNIKTKTRQHLGSLGINLYK